jgi:LysM repeat protein
VVKAGDNLNRIGQRYGVTAEQIAETNGFPISSPLRIGQRLIIPTPLPATSRSAEPGTATRAAARPTQTSVPSATTRPSTTPTLASQPTVSPSATAVPAPTGTPVPVDTVRAENVSITIPAYQYESALVASEPSDPIYPYPHLDFNRVGPPVPRTFQAVVLENPYTAITIIPELGGRIYRWVDKTTGRDLLYRNPVIKPTHWGYRGWWLAAGGIEWAFPIDEHGLNEYRPWQVQAASSKDQVTFLVSDTEERTGMTISVAIILDSSHSYFTVRPRLYNPTESAQPFQFWVNAMIALADNRNTPSLRFVLPTDRVTIHSTDDPALPGPKETVPWPIYQGRDLSRYGNWGGYLGFFSSPRAKQGFMGAYDATVDEGVVRTFNPTTAPGAKVFGPGTLDPSLWTDDDSNYVELWGGATPTFWDYSTLNPGEALTWDERWYPVSGIGGYVYADEQIAVNVTDADGTLDVRIASSGRFEGRVLLRQGTQTAARDAVSIRPGKPFRTRWPHPREGGALSLLILDDSGRQVATVPVR